MTPRKIFYLNASPIVKGRATGPPEAFPVRHISRARMKMAGFVALDFETKSRAHITEKPSVFGMGRKLLNSTIETIQ
jgi:hypothetical protein